MYMKAGSAGELGRQRGLEQIGFWQKLTAHPAYDGFWSEQAVDKVLAGAADGAYDAGVELVGPGGYLWGYGGV